MLDITIVISFLIHILFGLTKQEKKYTINTPHEPILSKKSYYKLQI